MRALLDDQVNSVKRKRRKREDKIFTEVINSDSHRQLKEAKSMQLGSALYSPSSNNIVSFINQDIREEAKLSNDIILSVEDQVRYHDGQEEEVPVERRSLKHTMGQKWRRGGSRANIRSAILQSLFANTYWFSQNY